MEKKAPTPKVTLSVGNPTSYPAGTPDENGKRPQRIAYGVTGSKTAIEMYKADLLARTGKEGKLDNQGNPLFTISQGKFSSAGMSATIVRGSKPDDNGNYNWFVDNQEQRDLDEIASGADETTKAEHARSKYEELKANVKALHALKRIKDAEYAASLNESSKID